MFKGWLCSGCNRGLGLLDDSIKGLELAMRYMLGQMGVPLTTDQMRSWLYEETGPAWDGGDGFPADLADW